MMSWFNESSFLLHHMDSLSVCLFVYLGKRWHALSECKIVVICASRRSFVDMYLSSLETKKKYRVLLFVQVRLESKMTKSSRWWLGSWTSRSEFNQISAGYIGKTSKKKIPKQIHAWSITLHLTGILKKNLVLKSWYRIRQETFQGPELVWSSCLERSELIWQHTCDLHYFKQVVLADEPVCLKYKHLDAIVAWTDASILSHVAFFKLN